MVNSDNFIGEQLVYALAKNGRGSIDPGMFINQSLDALFPDSVMSYRFYDAIGLSRYNQVTPAWMAKLLESQWQRFGHDKIKSVYPVGKKGQLPDEFIIFGDDVMAKTGSMRNVFALSGYLKSASGKWFVFSIMINGLNSPQKNIRESISTFLSQISEEY
jgi:D-alanyl-D-alanine carboxypeptidase/D-alanyl-D-alanine-endopeptidase (penicillin-binding protein 4)